MRHSQNAVTGWPTTALLVASSAVALLLTVSLTVITPPWQASKDIVMSASVCLSVCRRAYLWNHLSGHRQIFIADEQQMSQSDPLGLIAFANI